MVTLGQVGIWTGYALLGLFVLAGYLVPAGILLVKWFASRGWRDVDDADARVSLFTVRAGWRTAFAYMFIFKTTGMALIWTLPEVSAGVNYIKVSQIAASKVGIAIPVAMALAYAILEGVSGIMVILDYYEYLKRKEKRMLKAKAEEREAKTKAREQRLKAEVEEREAKTKAREQRLKAEVEEHEAQLKARDEQHAAEVARLNAEIERLKKRNGDVD